MAVLVRINLMIPFIHRGRGRWYMNTALIDDPHFRDGIKMEWSEWKNHICWYPSILHRWEHHVKRKVKYLFVRERTERKLDCNRMENFYYATIYNILQEPVTYNQKIATLKKMRAKIVWLSSTFHQRTIMDTGEHDKTLGETPSLYHIIKLRKRQNSRTIKRISDEHDKIHSTSMAIIKAFAMYFNENSNQFRFMWQKLNSYWIVNLDQFW